MLKTIAIAIMAAGLSMSAAPSFAQSAPAKTMKGAKGEMLVDMKGMTLYTFDKDTTDKSNCSGACAIAWPALTAGEGAKASENWTLVKRESGMTQWAYKGKPLYTWAKDSKPGDTTGDGVNKVWHIATP